MYIARHCLSFNFVKSKSRTMYFHWIFFFLPIVKVIRLVFFSVISIKSSCCVLIFIFLRFNLINKDTLSVLNCSMLTTDGKEWKVNLCRKMSVINFLNKDTLSVLNCSILMTDGKEWKVNLGRKMTVINVNSFD